MIKPHGRVAIIGGTGMIGRAVAHLLTNSGWQVRIIARASESAESAIPEMESYGELSPAGLTDVQAIINLAGAPLFGRIPTTKYKQILRDSRIETTKRMVTICRELPMKPAVIIQGSAIGIYGSDQRNDEALDETATLGDDFLSQLCCDWEAAAKPAEEMGIRVVYFRSGLVLDPNKQGLLGSLIPPFQWFVGGIIGSPHAWKPWVHIDDETGLMLHALTHDIRGPLNAVSPGVSTNREFFQALGIVLHRPCWLPVPEVLLRPVFREMATALCRGPRITGRVAELTEYTFKHVELFETLTSIFPS